MKNSDKFIEIRGLTKPEARLFVAVNERCYEIFCEEGRKLDWLSDVTPVAVGLCIEMFPRSKIDGRMKTLDKVLTALKHGLLLTHGKVGGTA